MSVFGQSEVRASDLSPEVDQELGEDRVRAVQISVHHDVQNEAIPTGELSVVT